MVCSFCAADSECKDRLETRWYAQEGKKERKRKKVQEVEGRKKNEKQVHKQLVVLLQQQQRFLKVHFIYFPGILFPGFTLTSFRFNLYLSRISILLGHGFFSFISSTFFPSFQILLLSMFSFHPLSWLDSYVLEFPFCLAHISSNI